MSFAKKMARKRDLAMRGNEHKAHRIVNRAEHDVKMAYRYQMATDMFVRKTALRNLSAVFLYAMHQYEGFGRSRLERLRRRESAESLQRFFDRWIPLEDAYFSAYGLPDESCIRIRM